MNEDNQVIVSDDNSDTENNIDGSEASEPSALEDTEDIEVSDNELVALVEVEPVNSAGLTHGQTSFFALGFFALLMFIYFICQRGSIGRGRIR